MVEIKIKDYHNCIMIESEENNNIRCNIARYDYGYGYLDKKQALKEAEQLVNKYKKEWKENNKDR